MYFQNPAAKLAWVSPGKAVAKQCNVHWGLDARQLVLRVRGTTHTTNLMHYLEKNNFWAKVRGLTWVFSLVILRRRQSCQIRVSCQPSLRNGVHSSSLAASESKVFGSTKLWLPSSVRSSPSIDQRISDYDCYTHQKDELLRTIESIDSNVRNFPTNKKEKPSHYLSWNAEDTYLSYKL